MHLYYLFGDVNGVIYDPNNAPMDSVVVSASGVSDTTGADGAYTLMNLNVGHILFRLQNLVFIQILLR